MKILLIRDIVRQALEKKYLSIDAEAQLRQMLRCKYDPEDLKAFMQLQYAVMSGEVKQEVRELKRKIVPSY